MKDVIFNIINNKNVDEIFKYILNDLYINGPVSITTLEILSYLYIYQPQKFAEHSNDILKFMGVYYKDIPTDNLQSVIFGMYSKHIQIHISIDTRPYKRV